MNDVARKRPGGRRAWLDVPEVGSAWGLKTLSWCLRLLGRRQARAALWPIACYYLATAPQARQASVDYLRRMGCPATWRAVLHHMLTFAQVSLDRLLFATGAVDGLHIITHGAEHLQALARHRRGAILLGAHLGSFEALRFVGDTIHIIGHFANAPRLNALLERLNPRINTKVIHAEHGGLNHVLQVRDVVAGGGLVGILGDRTLPGVRTTRVNFLGARVDLPAGPYCLGATLGCPIYVTAALYTPPNRYDCYCAPLSERPRIRRHHRDEDIRAYAQEFAGHLEALCRLSPHNWFNFYDFWQAGDNAREDP